MTLLKVQHRNTFSHLKNKKKILVTKNLQETAIERANSIFEKLDVNDDGSLDEQEFVDGCMNDERVAQLLNTGSGQQHINLEEAEEES